MSPDQSRLRGLQACWRAFTSKICCSTITFKATAKGPGKLKDSAVRDLWLPGLCFTLLFISSVSHTLRGFCRTPDSTEH